MSLGSVTAAWVVNYEAQGFLFTQDLSFDSGPPSSDFDGRVAHVCFFNRALSDADCDAAADLVRSAWSYTG